MARNSTWLEKLAALLFVIFCFELGVFLIVYPWLALWDQSYFSTLGFSFLGTEWETIWSSTWFRGGVSGLGVVNVLISFIEVGRLRTHPPRRIVTREFPSQGSELQ